MASQTLASMTSADALDGTESFYSVQNGADREVTAEQIKAYAFTGLVNPQTGTTYTLQASDNNKLLPFTNAGAITVTLPNDLPAGFTCSLVQAGNGAIGFAPASGATLHNVSGHAHSGGQYAAIALAVIANSGAAASYILTGATAT